MHMSRDLFGNVTDPSIKLGSRKWYTVPLSLLVHSLVLLAVIVVPLLATGTLPLPQSSVVFVPAVAAPTPPPPAVRRVEQVRKPSGNPNAAPLEAPETITTEPEIDPGFEGEAGGVGVDQLGVIHGVESLPEPPAPPRAQDPPKVRVGEGVTPPQKIHDVAPGYPLVAQKAGIQGVVIIEATIGVDGRVQDARVLRSSPFLDDAALAAVRQWIYTPTKLNGRPVSVIMTVTVHFTLQR
jgi:protein TonB